MNGSSSVIHLLAGVVLKNILISALDENKEGIKIEK